MEAGDVSMVEDLRAQRIQHCIWCSPAAPTAATHAIDIPEISVSTVFLILVYALYASVILVVGASIGSLETWSYWSMVILGFYLVLDILTDRLQVLIAAKIMIWFGTGALSIVSVLSLLAWMKMGSLLWAIGVIGTMFLSVMLVLVQIHAGRDREGKATYFNN